MQSRPRVALFADTFYEVNGAARTCREWVAYAERQRLPLFVVRSDGPAGASHPETGIEVPRGRLAFRVDVDLRFDPLSYRHLERIVSALREFNPDVVHLTSPGDLGILGAIAASKLRVPLALSWHTNLHEFAARRMASCLSWLPRSSRAAICGGIEQFVLDRVTWFFGRGDLIFAPNPALIDMLHRRTGKPLLPMVRGVDTRLFNPSRRNRAGNEIVIGYVGRLTPEKNVRFLARLRERLAEGRNDDLRFLVVGGGSERVWLEKELPGAYFTGVLTAESLARAYASMDIFVFPSRTDTFGNVVQEAMACGVPAVVTSEGGPQYIVNHGISGWVAQNDDEFCAYVGKLVDDDAMRHRMSVEARQQMNNCSWDAVFQEVYDGYRRELRLAPAPAEALAM